MKKYLFARYLNCCPIPRCEREKLKHSFMSPSNNEERWFDVPDIVLTTNAVGRACFRPFILELLPSLICVAGGRPASDHSISEYIASSISIASAIRIRHE